MTASTLTVGKPLTTHEMPNGQVVYYRDSDHSYWKDTELRKGGEWGGKSRLTGVSTVVGPFDFRPDTLLRWAAKSNGAGIAMLAAEGLSLEDADDMRTALRWLETPESIWRALVEAEATFEDIRERAANRGTNVHKHALHAMALGRAVPDFEEMTDEEKGFSRGVVAFWHEHEPEPLQSEQVVADIELGVAGRLDLRCLPKGRCERSTCPCQFLKRGGIAMVDAKTSGYLSNKAHVQLGGYEHCAGVSGFGESDAQWILQVVEDGTYNLVSSHGTAEDFIVGLDVYRRAGRIGRDASRARRVAEATA